jgi:hypothetical protein
MLSGFSVGSAPGSSSVFIRAMDTLGRQATVPKTGRNFAHEVVIPALQRGNEVIVSLSGMYVDFYFVWGFYVTLYSCVPEILVDCVRFTDFSGYVFNARMTNDAKSEARLYTYERARYELIHSLTNSYLIGEGYMSRESLEGFEGESRVDPFSIEEEDFDDGWSGI